MDDLRRRILDQISSQHLKITEIKDRFPMRRHEVHRLLHDLTYEGVVRPGWDWKYRMYKDGMGPSDDDLS